MNYYLQIELLSTEPIFVTTTAFLYTKCARFDIISCVYHSWPSERFENAFANLGWIIIYRIEFLSTKPIFVNTTVFLSTKCARVDIVSCVYYPCRRNSSENVLTEFKANYYLQTPIFIYILQLLSTSYNYYLHVENFVEVHQTGLSFMFSNHCGRWSYFYPQILSIGSPQQSLNDHDLVIPLWFSSYYRVRTHQFLSTKWELSNSAMKQYFSTQFLPQQAPMHKLCSKTDPRLKFLLR